MKISVILPVYEPNEKWLNQTVESVLEQSYRDLELIIVNDGSSKSIQDYISDKLLADDRVKIFHQENKGFAGATNRCIDEATGDLIAPIGDDDLWKKHKLEKQVKKLKEENADLVFNKIEIIDKEDRKIMSRGAFPENNYPENLFFEGVYPGYESLLIRSKIWKDLGFNENYKIAPDLDLWLKTFATYKIVYIDEELTKKRLHEDNISKNHLETLREVENLYRRNFDQFEFSSRDQRKIISKLYRRKAKGLFQDEARDELARKFLIESIINYPNFKSGFLYFVTFDRRLYEAVNNFYSKNFT